MEVLAVKMKKTIIFLTMMILMITLVSGAIECEYSLDNATDWSLITTTVHEGCIDTTANIASFNNLEPSTEYFVRCRNLPFDWGYESFTTDAGGIDEMIMGIIFGLSIIAILLAFATWYMEEGLKFAFMLATGLVMLIILMVLTKINTDASLVGLLSITYIVGVIGFLAMFFYVLVSLMVQLKAKKNPPPNMGSPLKQAKLRRKAKYGK